MALTPKQEKYVHGLVSGLSQRQAYIQAYSTKNMKDTTIDNNAYKLMQNNEISTRYNELIDEHKEKALWTREEAINDLKWLKEQAKQSILDEKFDNGYVRQGSATAFINAIKELNSLEDIYPDKTQNINLSGNVSNPYDELTADELRALINSE